MKQLVVFLLVLITCASAKAEIRFNGAGYYIKQITCGAHKAPCHTVVVLIAGPFKTQGECESSLKQKIVKFGEKFYCGVEDVEDDDDF